MKLDCHRCKYRNSCSPQLKKSRQISGSCNYFDKDPSCFWESGWV